MRREQLSWCTGRLHAIQHTQDVYTHPLWRTYTHEHACLIKHESRSFVRYESDMFRMRRLCEHPAELLSTVPLSSNMHSRDVQVLFYNHVSPVTCVLPVYLTTTFTVRCVTVQTSCQLCYFVVYFLYFCFGQMAPRALSHEWFSSSSSPRGWLSVNHFIRDIRAAGERSLPSTEASKKTLFSRRILFRQTSDSPFPFFL